MAITFVLGLPGSGKTTHCLREITNRISEAAGSALFYIVPEQFSLQAERLLVAQSPAQAVMHAQAISFGRLAYHVFAREGGAPTKQLNDTGKHMLLRKILHECELPFYGRAIGKPGFIESLSQTVTEFLQYSISPQDLERKISSNSFKLGQISLDENPVENSINESLSGKLADLATIFRSYRSHVTGRYLVTGETLDLLADALFDNDYLRDAFFWVDGFNGFTPQECRIIGRIMPIAREVIVTLTMDALPRDDTSPRVTDFFYPTKCTYQTLKRLANNLGVPVAQPIILSELQRHKSSPSLQTLVKSFPHSFSKAQQHTKELDIEVFSAPDKASELVMAAEWVKHNVTEKGWRFKDMAILCGDLGGYERLALNIFAPYGIPVFVDSKTGILSHPLTELIRAGVEVAAWDWQYEAVFRVLKTGFTGLETDEIDRLENYVLARGIKGWRWRKEWREMEDTRQKVLELFAPFLEGLRPDKVINIAELSRRVYAWLYDLDAPGTLARLLEESIAANDQAQARWHRQIWPRIAEIFDKLVEILGEGGKESRVTVREFAEILDTGFSYADLGLIPPSLDQLVMGDINRSRYPAIKGLWVLGANDGQLPPPVPGSSLLTEDERASLRRNGLELAPDLPRRYNDSLLSLYGAICQPTNSLTFSYSRTGSDGKPLRPSPILTRLKHTFPGLTEKPWEVISETINVEIKAEVEVEVEAEVKAEPTSLSISNNSAQILYGGSFITSASQLEAFVQCPFAHFMKYHLQVKEREIYQVKALDLGVFYHEVLARSTRSLTESNKWHEISRPDMESLVNTHAETLLFTEGGDHVLHSSARNAYILQRVKRICAVSLWALCEQYRRGTFETVGIETGFTTHDGTNGIVLQLNPHQTMTVTGRIDRVDTLEHDGLEYIKILDYKSGRAKFSMEEVEAGQQLQLPLYMNALLTNPDMNPGGIFYFNIDDPILQSNEALDEQTREALLLQEFRLSGLTLSEQPVVIGMDKHLWTKGGHSPVIPVSLNKDGSFSKNSSIVNQNEFARLCQSVEEKVKEIGSMMASGIIGANPFKKGTHTACDYCSYGAVCGFHK